MTPITLNFHGKSVRLLTLLEQLKSFPLIDVSHEELDSGQTFANRSRAVDDSEEEVSVYKHEGAYIVLTGRKAIDLAGAENRTTFAARLVSKHAFKRLQSMGEDTKVKAPAAPQALGRQFDTAPIGDQIRQGFAAARPAAALLDKNRQR